MSSQNVVTLKASILAGPPKSTCGKFPSGLVSLEFELRPPNKNAAVMAQHVRDVSSPSAYVTLGGVGTGQAVTQASFLYLRTSVAMDLRLTTSDSVDVVSVHPVDGVLLMEFPAAKYLKLLEVQGSGTLEYFVSGNQ